MGFFSNLFGKKNYDQEMKEQANVTETNVVKEEAINALSSSDFMFEVEDVFTITGRGTVVTGRVSSGTLNLNDEVLINGTIPTVVTGIEMFRKTLDFAQAGDNCGILLKDISRDQIQRGDKLTKQ